MKIKWLILMLLVLCLWPITIHLVSPQTGSAHSSIHPNKACTPTQEDIILANIQSNKMCHAAAEFGFDAADRGLTKEQMHQELREILK